MIAKALSLLACLWALIPATLLAQGTIYGEVTRSTGGSPDTGSFTFFGFVNNSDKEVKVVGADGAGYDGTHWWDDFQNYLTHAAGLPYDYYFFDTATSQASHLQGSIPNNSFQLENVMTAPAVFPDIVTILSALQASDSTVTVVWRGASGLRYHVYRRVAGINGSFFRRDNMVGDLSDPGVLDTFFVDPEADPAIGFEYVVIAEDAQRRFSPPSTPVIAQSYLCGDADGSSDINLSDVVSLINYIFTDGPAPNPLAAGDADCSGGIDLSDAVYLVSYIFTDGPAPCTGC